jgi:hypothetical protein
VPNVVAAIRGGRPFVPSISGGFTFQKSSDIQEVRAGFSFPRGLHSGRRSRAPTSIIKSIRDMSVDISCRKRPGAEKDLCMPVILLLLLACLSPPHVVG